MSEWQNIGESLQDAVFAEGCGISQLGILLAFRDMIHSKASLPTAALERLRRGILDIAASKSDDTLAKIAAIAALANWANNFGPEPITNTRP